MKTQDHHLEQSASGYRCTVCLWTWKQYPQSDCPGLPRFGYGQVPPFLLSYTQLKRRGKKPQDRARPDGCYYVVGRREWLYLYDEREARARRQETAKQKEARERSWLAIQEKYRCPECSQAPANLSEIKDYRPGGLRCDRCEKWQRHLNKQARIERMIAEDERATCAWAASMMARDDWCILDTETTSLTGSLVEIAVSDREGTTLFHSLVNPEVPVSEGARAVHQISDEELAKAPTLPDIWEDFIAALRGRTTIVTFNLAFDKAVLFRSASRYGLSMPTLDWQCLMKKYAEYVGEWSQYHGDYRWQRLPGGDHRAQGDATAALEVMRHMAAHLAWLMAQNTEQEVPQ